MHHLINLTAHNIVVIRPDGTKINIAPSGNIARVQLQKWESGSIDSIPLWSSKVDIRHVSGIPDLSNYPDVDSVVLITSSLLAQVVRTYKGARVVSPDTGRSAVRDTKGNIVAVRGFVSWQE